jgi:hypothetical protein
LPKILSQLIVRENEKMTLVDACLFEGGQTLLNQATA